MATQSADGYIGTYPDSCHLGDWDIWGRKYVLLGLLAYYDQTKETVALEAARRVADHLIAEAGPGERDEHRRDRLDRLERTGLLLRTRTHNASLSTDRRETLPRFRTAYRPLVGRAEPTGTGGPPPDSGGYRRNGTVEDELGRRKPYEM